MLTAPIEPKTEIEQEIFGLWKELDPNSAFTYGLPEFAGKIFIPSKENVASILKKIRTLKSKAENEVQQKLLESYESDMVYDEPQYAPSNAVWAIYSHKVRGAGKEQWAELLSNILLSLKISRKGLESKNWPLEIRILTSMRCNSLIYMADLIKNRGNSSLVKQIQKEAALYRLKLGEKRLQHLNSFGEVWNLLQEGKGFNRRGIYDYCLKVSYNYTETPEAIEKRAEMWLEDELPKLRSVVSELSQAYGCEASETAVEAEIQKRRAPKDIKSFLVSMRTQTLPIIKKNLCGITPDYDVRIVETPNYLRNFIPTAAIEMYDLFKKPYIMFYVTPDDSHMPGLLQTLIHEEYGHAINFLNSASDFVAKPSFVELLPSDLDGPLTEGISFHREMEFLQMMKSGKVKLNGIKDWPLFVKEFEFVTLKWRVIRFLRAIGDVRLNLNKQTPAEFITWAHEKTGLAEKDVYNQVFLHEGSPGYIPSYAVVGMRIAELQKKAKKKGKSIRDFNTYAASIGFPARTIWEKKLIRWINN